MKTAPLIRIILRYASATGFMGAGTLASEIANDPDAVAILSDVIMWASAIVAGAVEVTYAAAKKRGWNL